MELNNRTYLKNEKIGEPIKKVLAALDGLTYADAVFVLDCTRKELELTSFVRQDATTHLQ